jgi:hypothetical protein
MASMVLLIIFSSLDAISASLILKKSVDCF